MTSFELEEERRQQAVKLDYFQTLKNRYPIIILTLLLVLITAALISYLWTARYQASAKFKINKFSNPVLVDGSRNVLVDGAATGMFFQNEVEMIRSPELIRIAVEGSDLPTQWGGISEEACVGRIQAGLRVSPSINTEIVTITFRDENRDVAKEVIRRIMVAYESERIKTETDTIRKGLGTYDDLILKKEVDVQTKRQRVLDLLGEYKITPGQQRWGIEPSIKETEGADRKQFLVSNLEAELIDAKSKEEALQNVDSEDLVVILAPLELKIPSIERLLPQLQEMRSLEEQYIQDGLGPNHPKRKTLREQMSQTEENLRSAVATTRKSTQIQIKRVEEKLRQARIDLEDELDQNRELAPILQIYQEAEKQYQRADDELSQQRLERNRIAMQSQMYRNPIQKLQLPRASTSTVEPNWTLNFALGGALGLAMGIALAFILELSDTTVRSMEEIEAYLNVPVLAVIPRGIGVLTLQSGASPDAEAYRILRTNIEFNRDDNNANLMTVISGSAGEGKTTTLVNLAYVCAQGGYNTLVIDADLRRPQLHRYFETDNQIGLTTYLTKGLELEDVAVQTSVDHLFFIPSGILPQDASGLLNSSRMSELLEDVKQRFDLVLVDSPPVLGVSDGAVIMSMVDFAVAIVQHRKLPRKLLLRMKQVIDNAGGKLLGVVLNNVDINSDSQYQYYTSYYTYYAAEDRDVAEAQTVQRVSPSANSGKSNEDLY